MTAQRVGEVSGMAVAELDLKGATWTLPGARTKNGHRHVVPLSATAVEIIRQALADAGDDAEHVFPSKDGHGPLSPWSWPRRSCARRSLMANDHTAGSAFRTGPLTICAGRHSPTSLRSASHPVVAGAVANHVSVTKATITLAVYTHYTYDREKREALELWADRLGAIVKGNAPISAVCIAIVSAYEDDGYALIALGRVTRYNCKAMVIVACGDVILRKGVDLRRRYKASGQPV